MVQMPLIEIPPTSMANHLLREGRSTEMPRGLALWGGFGDLRQYRLIDRDEEVRIWGGFGNTNLGGLILRKRKGTWTAVRLTGGLDGTKLRPSKRVFASPRSGWPAFWRRIEALGLWSLPDDSTLSPKGRKVALDGFSYLVEIQRHGVYRAYAYDNPESQTQWPEAERMVWIGRLLDREFPYRIP